VPREPLTPLDLAGYLAALGSLVLGGLYGVYLMRANFYSIFFLATNAGIFDVLVKYTFLPFLIM